MKTTLHAQFRLYGSSEQSKPEARRCAINKFMCQRGEGGGTAQQAARFGAAIMFKSGCMVLEN